ncbi:MAG TPA: hypothetical protein VGB27_10580, partial [Candidatus Binatia bacterium]
SQIAVEPYRKERLLFLVSNTHRLARKTTISLREFQRVPLIIPEPNGVSVQFKETYTRWRRKD